MYAFHKRWMINEWVDKWNDGMLVKEWICGWIKGWIYECMDRQLDT